MIVLNFLVALHRANHELHQMLTAAEYVVSVCVFYYKLTDFPVPGFQWYPNTSSRLTVLLLSTSFSSSSWEEKRYSTENPPKITLPKYKEETLYLQQRWEVDEPEVIIGELFNLTLPERKYKIHRYSKYQ